MTVTHVAADTDRTVRPAPGQSLVRSVVWTFAAIVTMSLAVLTSVSFPDRISFINDEPRQLAKAFHANKDGTLVAEGLQGNFQLTYGPTAAQIYQVILLFTHDPLMIAAVRAGLSAGITALGLLWLSRTLRFNPWFATAVVLAPFLWVFHRIIWDASWAMPISTLGLAAYASFMKSGGPLRLSLAIFCTLLLPFIHPQDILLAAPIGLHMLWKHWRSLLRYWPAVLIPLVIVLAVNIPYIQHVRKEVRQMRESGGSGPSIGQYPDGVVPGEKKEWIPPRVKSFLSPMLSGRLLSGYKFVDGGFSSDSPVETLIRAGKTGAFMIYPLIWIGTVVAAAGLLRRRRKQQPGDVAALAPASASASTKTTLGSAGREVMPIAEDRMRERSDAARRRDPASVRNAIAIIALASAVFQALLFGIKRIPIEPQYFFGTLPAHVLLAWFAVDWLKRFRLATPTILAYGLSVGAVTLGCIWLDSVRPMMFGTPRTSRPEILPLGMQVDAAASLNAYADTYVVTDVTFYQRFPQALRSLRLMMAPRAPEKLPTHGSLVLTFGDGPEGPASRLVLVKGNDPAQVGKLLFVTNPIVTHAMIPFPRAAALNVKPLPKGWLPGMREE